MDTANLLKPALAHSKLQCLKTTTINKYQKYIEKNPALKRHFQPLYIKKPDRSTTVAILRKLKSRYEIHHNMQINDNTIITAIDLSLQYLTNRHLPNKAIDLVDKAASQLHLQIDSMPTIMDELRAKINQLKIEHKAIGHNPKNQKALAKLNMKLKAVREDYQEIKVI